jgi:hypothetical protein
MSNVSTINSGNVWVIAPGQMGRDLIGVIHQDKDEQGEIVLYLEPFYELEGLVYQNDKGEMVRNFRAFPLCALVSLERYVLPTVLGAPLVIPTSTLSAVERKIIAEAVTMCQELIEGWREKDRGIVLAKPGDPVGKPVTRSR